MNTSQEVKLNYIEGAIPVITIKNIKERLAYVETVIKLYEDERAGLQLLTEVYSNPRYADIKQLEELCEHDTVPYAPQKDIPICASLKPLMREVTPAPPIFKQTPAPVITDNISNDVELKDYDIIILKYLSNHAGEIIVYDNPAIIKELNLSSSSIYRGLRRLTRAGLIVKVTYNQYGLTPSGRALCEEL